MAYSEFTTIVKATETFNLTIDMMSGKSPLIKMPETIDFTGLQLWAIART